MTEEIKLYLDESRAAPVVHAIQGEANARTLSIKLYDSGGVIQLGSGKTFLYVLKNDRHTVQVPATVAGTIITVTLPYQAATCPGKNQCFIQAVTANSDKRFGSFILDVTPCDFDGEIDSTDEFCELQDLLDFGRANISLLNGKMKELDALLPLFTGKGVQVEKEISLPAFGTTQAVSGDGNGNIVAIPASGDKFARVDASGNAATITLDDTFTWQDIAGGNGEFVVTTNPTGGSATVFQSQDGGASFYQAATSFTYTGTPGYACAKYFNGWFAIFFSYAFNGVKGGALSSSAKERFYMYTPDGGTSTICSFPAGVKPFDMAFGNGKYVMVGQDSGGAVRIYTTQSLSDWTAVYTLTDSPQFPRIEFGEKFSLLYTDGGRCSSLSSVDGTGWEKSTVAIVNPTAIQAFTYGSGIYIAPMVVSHDEWQGPKPGLASGDGMGYLEMDMKNDFVDVFFHDGKFYGLTYGTGGGTVVAFSVKMIGDDLQEAFSAELKAHADNQELHTTPEEKAYLNSPFDFFEYEGNSKSTRTFTLPFAPAMVLIYSSTRPIGYYYSGRVHITSGFGLQGENNSSKAVALNGAELTVKELQDTVMSYTHMNDSGQQYKVILFRGV